MSADNEGRIAVLVVDHNQILLEGIAVLIRSQPDFELVGAARTASAASALYFEWRADIVVIDLELPDSTGIALIRSIQRGNLNAKLIGLATTDVDISRYDPATLGIKSIITKDRIQRQLVPLIHSLFKSRK